MDVRGCTKYCEDVNCSFAVCATCCSRCDERKEENRGSVSLLPDSPIRFFLLFLPPYAWIVLF